MKLPSRLKWLWLTLAIVILDRATKAFDEEIARRQRDSISQVLLGHFNHRRKVEQRGFHCWIPVASSKRQMAGGSA